MRALFTICVVAIACVVAPAEAQDEVDSFFGISFGLGNARTLETWEMPVRFEGSVVVHFESAFGSGRIVWSPGRRGQFSVAENKTKHGRRTTAFLASTDALGATSRVERAGGVCTDTAGQMFDQAAVEQGKDAIRIGLASSTPGGPGFHMTETRCGGPLLDDLGRALGMVRVSRSQLTKGAFDVDFRKAATPISAPGMTGSVESSVVAHVGKRTKPTTARARPGGRTTRLRSLDVEYRVASVSGSLGWDILGGGEVCAELDSCDARESVTLAAGKAEGSAALSAIATAKRPLRDLRTAVGLASGGRTKGLAVGGYGYWTSEATTLAASLERSGAPACQDERHLAALALRLEPVGSRVQATVQTGTAQVGRTACPGPALGTGTEGADLVSASLPLRAFARKRVTLRLTEPHELSTEGWSGGSHGSLVVVLERTRITLRTLGV